MEKPKKLPEYKGFRGEAKAKNDLIKEFDQFHTPSYIVENVIEKVQRYEGKDIRTADGYTRVQEEVRRENRNRKGIS